MKKYLFMGLSLALCVAMAITGTLAYLQDSDSDVNVMSLGEVDIEQLQYERVVENGAWVSTGETDKYGYTPDKLQAFTQNKPLYPAVFTDGEIKWDDRNGGSYQQSWGQVGTSGSNQLFDDSVKNVVDHFTFVKNNGINGAYVRTWFAFEQGEIAGDNFKNVIMTNANKDHWSWETVATDVEIDGNEYVVMCATYLGPKSNPTGVLASGATTYPSLLQIYMRPEATNEDVQAIDGNDNGLYDVLVVSQAVQVDGFKDSATALNAAFGKATKETAIEVFRGTLIPDGYVVNSVNGLDSAIAAGEDKIWLASGDYSNDVIDIPEEYTGTITIADSVINSIKAEDTANLVIKGDVTVTATSGSAITGKEINISGNGNLTAIAADEKAAFGIGGIDTEKITIKDVTIKEVKGGFDGQIGTDTKYYKDAPEGGSAIGSGFNGAVIELNNVHIEKAIGGSKSAGIGARYHVGANVTIINSTIDYVEGGATAAAIGGSRVSGDATEDGITINITNSTITAKGGVYAAGIGSGYDTHCGKNQPLCTINITDSTINATGGQYAAGVGTGYHNAALAGEIKNSTVTAVSGEKFYKDTYTKAQDIGFGVVDPAREGVQTGSKLTYNGTVIGIPAV